jgi:hypothetical protein
MVSSPVEIRQLAHSSMHTDSTVYRQPLGIQFLDTSATAMEHMPVWESREVEVERDVQEPLGYARAMDAAAGRCILRRTSETCSVGSSQSCGGCSYAVSRGRCCQSSLLYGRTALQLHDSLPEGSPDSVYCSWWAVLRGARGTGIGALAPVHMHVRRMVCATSRFLRAEQRPESVAVSDDVAVSRSVNVI